MTAEEAFVRAFLRPEKRARFLHALARQRQELLARLGHDLPCQSGLVSEVPDRQDYPAELEKLLRAKGAGPTCHVIARGLKADGRELPLREALDQVCLQPWGALLLCLPERLAYYRPDAPGAGLILERHPSSQGRAGGPS